MGEIKPKNAKTLVFGCIWTSYALALLSIKTIRELIPKSVSCFLKMDCKWSFSGTFISSNQKIREKIKEFESRRPPRHLKPDLSVPKTCITEI